MGSRQAELTIVVAGSFSEENLPYVQRAIGYAALAGIEVSAPLFGTVQNPGEAFAILDTDEPDVSPRDLELAFMGKIALADTLLVVNDNPTRRGRIGLSAAAEIAWATICGVPFAATNQEGSDDNLYFSGEVEPDERAALGRLEHMPYDISQPGLAVWKQRKAVSKPMPVDHPDYPILLGLRNRLLESLPAETKLV